MIACFVVFLFELPCFCVGFRFLAFQICLWFVYCFGNNLFLHFVGFLVPKFWVLVGPLFECSWVYMYVYVCIEWGFDFDLGFDLKMC